MCCGVFSLSQYHLLCNLVVETGGAERDRWTTARVIVVYMRKTVLPLLSRAPVLFPMYTAHTEALAFSGPGSIAFFFIEGTSPSLFFLPFVHSKRQAACVCDGLRLWLIAGSVNVPLLILIIHMVLLSPPR